MELKFIKTNKCPICGCETVISEEVERELNSTKIREHAMGGRWEYRKFACGYETHYCPNFRKEVVRIDCSYNPEILERNRKRKEAKDLIYAEIEKLDVDEEYKKRLKAEIKYV